MALIEYLGSRRRMTWWDYYSLQFLRLIFAVLALGLIVYAIYSEHRDRPSLQWPKVSGTVTQCDEVSSGRRHRNYRIAIIYTYTVSGRNYAGNQIALWNADWQGKPTGPFMAAHPVNSAVDVYYQPQHPQNAVLIRGPDELGNRIYTWGGVIGLAGGIWWIFMTRKTAADVKAKVQAARDQTGGIWYS